MDQEPTKPTPYNILDEAELARRRGLAQQSNIDPRRVRPDGSVEDDGSVAPDVMREFLEKVSAGAPPAEVSSGDESAIFAKVAAFLDPKTQGPMTIIEARHKLFVMRVPRSQEMIDVLAFTGQKMSESEQTIAQFTLEMVGECMKSCLGWVPANSTDAQLLRAQFHDPTKWPPLRALDWLQTRDGSYIENEVQPLWKAFKEWLVSVTPTSDEIDFYYSRLA